MKIKNKKSLINSLTGIFVTTNIIIAIFLIITPFIYYQIYIEGQYYKIVNYIKTHEDMSARDIGFYVYEHGYDVANENNVFSDNFDYCQMKDVYQYRKNLQTSRKIIVEFDHDCSNMVISLNFVLLHGFTNFYFLITFFMTVLVVIGNIISFKRIKENVQQAFNNVKMEIAEIRLTNRNNDYQKHDSQFEEFQDVINNIEELNIQINDYISERHSLVSSLNHELKSPINKVNSLIQAYEMKIPGYEDPDKFAKIIQGELDILIDIINFSLEVFVKTEIKEIESVNVTELIERLISNREEVFKLQNISCDLRLQKDIYLKTDKHIIGLVISNLVENIAKYTKEGSVVKIYLDEKQVIFENEISQLRDVGTQQGLKLSIQLIKSAGFNLTYHEYGNKFIVKIYFG